MQRCRVDHANRADEPPFRRHRGARDGGRPFGRRGRRHRPRQPPRRSRGPLLLCAGPRQRRARLRHRGRRTRRDRCALRALHPGTARARRHPGPDHPWHHATGDGAVGCGLLRLPRPGLAHDRGHRHQRQDDGHSTARRSPHRVRSADQRHGHAVRRAHHARGHRGRTRARRRARPATLGRPPPRRRHGGLEPCPRAVEGRRHPLRCSRVHESQPRPSRLSRHHGGLLRGEGATLHLEPCAPRRGERRRSVGTEAARAGAHPDGRGAARRCGRRCLAPGPHRVHLAGPPGRHAAHGWRQRRQHPARRRGRAGLGPGPRAVRDRSRHGASRSRFRAACR